MTCCTVHGYEFINSTYALEAGDECFLHTCNGNLFVCDVDADNDCESCSHRFVCWCDVWDTSRLLIQYTISYGVDNGKVKLVK